MTRRRRGLTEEDALLWAHVVETVLPLKPRRRKAPKRREPQAAPEAVAAAAPESPAPAPARAPAPLRRPPAPKAPPAPPPIPPLAPIDKNERRRLVRGTRGIDGRIDLHGMRQAEAHTALRGFLAHSQMRGDTLVLIITGKGREDGQSGLADERGVLRRVVPQWLRMPDMRPFVVGFEEAHQGHGGGGALYVRIRRVRRGAAP